MRRPAIAIAIAVTTLGLSACTGHGVADVTLAQLVAQQADYVGRQVLVSGTLRSHPDPEHYWIEDDKYHRVALDDVDGLHGRDGEELIVRGLFLYDDVRGRFIVVDSL